MSIRTQGTDDALNMGTSTSTFGGYGSTRTGYENPRMEVQWAPKSLIKGSNNRVQRPKNVTMMSIRTQWSGRRDLKVEVWWVQGPGKSIEYTDLGVESLRYKDPVDLKIQEQKQKE
ncbi:hypothetical protein SESBI_29153 [Sesbania bispinosa]|nr:hypothetical protein SESBI_29153 [Sesbania bispinosa]